MSTSLTLTQIAIDHLNQTRKWTHFLSVVGFVMCACLAVGALLFGTVMSSKLDFADELIGFISSGFITVIYLVVALICFFLYLYLFRFSKRLKTAINTNNSEALAEGFKDLKAHYRLSGILTIVAIGFYVIAILIGIIGAIAAM